MSRPIFVAGATGKQGTALIRSLLSAPSFSPQTHPIYALTRDPASASSQRLASSSPAINLIKGNWADASSAFAQLPSSSSSPLWGAFILTMPGKREALSGKALVDASIAAGAQHIVFTSVERGSANGGFNPTDVPHFQTKHEIERHIMDRVEASNGKLSYTILRPVFFLDNLEMGFIGKVISVCWRDNVRRKLQVVDTRDIGALAAQAFLRCEDPEYRNQAISVAGDELTFEEADSKFREKTGGVPIPVTYGFFGTLLLWVVGDMKKMFDFFDGTGYTADIGRVKRLVGVTGFEEWVDKSKFGKKQA